MRKRTARGRLHCLGLSDRSVRHLCFSVIRAFSWSRGERDERIVLPRRTRSQSSASLGCVTQPGHFNYPIAILIVAILVAYVGMVYGPIGAFIRNRPSTSWPYSPGA